MPPPPDDDDDVFLDDGDDENGDYSLSVAPTVIPPDDAVAEAPPESVAPEHVPTPTVPVPTPTPSVIHICDTPGCRRRPESDPRGLAQVDQHVCCDPCACSPTGRCTRTFANPAT